MKLVKTFVATLLCGSVIWATGQEVPASEEIPSEQEPGVAELESVTSLDNLDRAPATDPVSTTDADSTSVSNEIAAPAPEQLSEATVISNLFTGYVNSLGGARKLRKIKSRVVKGTIETDQGRAEFETYQTSEGHFLNVIHLPAEVKHVGFDGEVVWEKTGDEAWTELDEADAASAKVAGSITGALDWREYFTDIQLLPDSEINGRTVKVVQASNVLGVSQKIFFDAQKHRVVRVDKRSDPNDPNSPIAETYLKDYRAVDDVVIPFIEEHVLPEMTITKRTITVEHDTKLDKKLFTPPKAGAVAKSGTRDTERHFASLTVGGIIYTNVWVHRQTNYNVLIRHSQGIHTIRLTDLPKEDLDELRPQLGDLANIEEQNNVVADKWDEIAGDAELRAMVQEKAQMLSQVFFVILIPFLIGWLICHLITSYIIKRLCDKTETKGGFAVWLPFVQLAPMFRAAGFSDKWIGSILALIVIPTLLFAAAPFAGFEVEPGSAAWILGGALSLIGTVAFLVATFAWPFKICSRCKKSPYLGLLMFVPLVNVGFLLHLAFSRDE